MAKILRHETTLGARRRAIDRDLRTANLQRIGAGIVLLFLLALIWAPAFRHFGENADRNILPRALGSAFLVALLVGWEWHRRELAAEAVNLQAGERGEQKLADRLAEQLADDVLILNDLSFKLAHERFQIDHLILAPQGIAILESKFWAGELTGTASAHQWKQKRTTRGRTVLVKSPLLQVERQRRLFISLFPLPFDETRVYAQAVFTHPRVRLNIEHAGDRAVTIDQAIRRLNDLCFDPPVWSPEAQRAFADRILATQPRA